MAKRVREADDVATGERIKRLRPSRIDRLSSLSNELLLKILSFLPVPQLIVVARLSHKYHALTQDSQLWKAHYYQRFVRPRVSRLPSLTNPAISGDDLKSTTRASRWLDDDHLVKRGEKTDWKRQYKLRHNWARGSAAIEEIQVSERAAIPPTLVCMHNGVVFTADQDAGLRAWSAKGTRHMIAQQPFQTSPLRKPPTSIAVDANAQEHDDTRVLVGFEDGSYSLYLLQPDMKRYMLLYSHEASSNGVVSSVALSWPYAVTMTATQLLSLYRFEEPLFSLDRTCLPEPPRLLHSLKSHTVWPPLSTSLRTSASAIFVCVAYTLPTYLSGFTVGIQEIKITPEGKLLDSRLASAINQHYRPLAFSTRPMMHHLTPLATAAHAAPHTAPALELRHIHSKPTSISYTHPYLLVSHPDNTLTLYLVTSTKHMLSISAGSRLWGHTSSVSGAHVSSRGKAVSISRRGDELRIWELEGGFASTAAKKRLAGGDLSVQIRSDERDRDATIMNRAISLRGKNGGCAMESTVDESSDLTLTRGWIGFDDENVVVLKEGVQGQQSLWVYDFT